MIRRFPIKLENKPTFYANVIALHDILTLVKLDIVFRAARDGILSRLGRRRAAASHY